MADKKERVSMPTGQNKMKEYLQQSQTGTSKPTVAMPEQEQTNPVQEQTVSDGELWNKFLENMIKYTGVKEQGSAVWLPSDVKKRVDDFRATAKRNIPIRMQSCYYVLWFLAEPVRQLYQQE